MMENTWEQGWQEYEARIRKLDRGEKAILKRNIGNLIEESRGCFSLAFRLKEGLPLGVKDCAPANRDNILFMMAALCAFHPEGRKYGTFGEALHVLKMVTESGSLDMKVTALLDESVTQDPKSFFHRLSQLVRLLKSKEIGLNWAVLMADIAQWDRSDKTVQKKWMRDYVKEVKSDAD